GLQRMERRASREALHGLDRAAVALDRERETGKERHAVHEHRAGAALAELATVLGPGEPQILAQHLEQGLVRRERRLERLAIDAYGDVDVAADVGRSVQWRVHGERGGQLFGPQTLHPAAPNAKGRVRRRRPRRTGIRLSPPRPGRRPGSSRTGSRSRAERPRRAAGTRSSGRGPLPPAPGAGYRGARRAPRPRPPRRGGERGTRT